VHCAINIESSSRRGDGCDAGSWKPHPSGFIEWGASVSYKRPQASAAVCQARLLLLFCVGPSTTIGSPETMTSTGTDNLRNIRVYCASLIFLPCRHRALGKPEARHQID
jgi:hypothetical protein